MSSTSRGGLRSEADQYPTPPWAVHRLLEACSLPPGAWLEPGAGAGSIIRAVNSFAYPGVIDWTAIEVEPAFEAPLREALPRGEIIIGDLLTTTLARQPFKVAIGNPPYRLAMEFILKSFEVAEYVAMLLRVNFLGSQERHPFWQLYIPDIYLLPNRPSFRGTGSDSIEYAWFVWGPERGDIRRPFGQLRVLALTPEEVRKSQKSQLPLSGKRDIEKGKKMEKWR